MPVTSIDAQPVDLLHAIPPDFMPTRVIPRVTRHRAKRRDELNRHRVSEPGKVLVSVLWPGIVPARRRRLFAWGAA